MKDIIKQMTDEEFEDYFEVCIVPYIKKHHQEIFPDFEKNLCLEHYNIIHKTNFNENDIELNPAECWMCKQIKDRP